MLFAEVMTLYTGCYFFRTRCIYVCM